MFQVLIGERWNEIFYDCWRGIGSLWSSVYFISLIFFGNIIMMNLFLAMLLGNFERASLFSEIAEEEEKLKILMPTSTKPNVVEIELTEEKEKPRSILKNPTIYSNPATPSEVKSRRRGGRLLKDRLSSDNTVHKKPLRS